MMPAEVWKDVQGYEGLYQVSSYGKVLALPRTRSNGIRQKSRLLALQKDSDGYLRTRLTSREGTRKTFKVHRLVAMAFIPNPLDMPEVNHSDGKKDNNVVSNLEWSNRSLNIQHCYDNKLKECLMVNYKGQEISFRKLAAQNNIKYTTAIERVRAGWPPIEAATKLTRKGNYK